MAFLSIKEASRRIGISEQAVHKRIRSGTLKGTKSNGRWRIDESSVEASIMAPPKKGRPWTSAKYMLQNGPYDVMEFTYREETGTFMPGEVLDADRAPLGTISNRGNGRADGLRRWWEHRSIPESREGMDERLDELGLENPHQIPFRNLGLSLSDQYWIRPIQENIKWEDVNYFQNPFGGNAQSWDSWLSDVGLSSPDNTSEGALPKRWICEGDKRILLKGHNPWTDQQPYNEAIASMLHSKILDLGDYVPYEVRTIEGLGVASACPCFVKPYEEYVPMNLVQESEGRRKGETEYDNVIRISVNLGIPESTVHEAMSKMIICDGIIANSDRHLRNFGLIRNIDELTWKIAPLFDSGNSLWFDKDESDVGRENRSFTSRPFNANPNRQLMYALSPDWLDVSALEEFPESACEMLAESDLARWRLDYIRKGITERINAVKEICL